MVMAGFAGWAAALVLVLGGLALWPLWRVAPQRTALLLGVMVLATGGLYRWVGTPEALDPVNVETPRSMEQAIAQLELRLQREPGEVQGWVLLGRSRMAQGDAARAREAFAKAHALLPDDVDLMTEYADAQLRAATDRRMPESARRLLERVVQAQPQHARGLFLLGVQRLQSGRAAEAVELWERLLPLVEPATAEALKPQIAAARAEAGMPEAVPAASTAVAVNAAPRLHVTVAVEPAIAMRVPAGAVLYVFARTADGAGLPVAVKRLAAEGFPLELELSDSDGLMPAQKLSMQTQVRLMARISRGGDAAGASGDFESAPLLVEVKDGTTATLQIDQVKP